MLLHACLMPPMPEHHCKHTYCSCNTLHPSGHAEGSTRGSGQNMNITVPSHAQVALKRIQTSCPSHDRGQTLLKRHKTLLGCCAGMARGPHLELGAGHELVRAAGQLGALVGIPPPAVRARVLDVVVGRLRGGAAEGAGEPPAGVQPDHVRVHVRFALAAAHRPLRAGVHHLDHVVARSGPGHWGEGVHSHPESQQSSHRLHLRPSHAPCLRVQAYLQMHLPFRAASCHHHTLASSPLPAALWIMHHPNAASTCPHLGRCQRMLRTWIGSSRGSGRARGDMTTAIGMAPTLQRSLVAGTAFRVARMQRGLQSPVSLTMYLLLAGGGRHAGCCPPGCRTPAAMRMHTSTPPLQACVSSACTIPAFMSRFGASKNVCLHI